MNKPQSRPNSSCFGSGPTRKRPGWSLSGLKNACLGRGHRSPAGQAKLAEVINLTREILLVPDDYRIAITPGSATGALECALWNLLGNRGVDVFEWDVFGHLWVTDIVHQLKIQDVRVYSAPCGQIPDLFAYNSDRDAVFTWNGTAAGVCVPHLEWIPDNREGLTICDAASSAFCVEFDWSKLDVVTFSWQKGLGSEAAHGMLIIGPRAAERLQTYLPPWPVPRLFRLTNNQTIIEEFFQGATINTPSLLCVEDCLDALRWVQNQGGLAAMIARCQNNFQAIGRWVRQTPWLSFMAENPATISPTSVCLKFFDNSGNLFSETFQRAVIAHMEMVLATENVAYDIRNHKYSPPSLRLWAGPTIDTVDLEQLFPWLEWAYEQALRSVDAA
jgi:phosphoserine aminotransferase